MDDGIYVDMSDREYHADTSLSASGAKLLLPPSVPAKFRERMDNPPEPKPHFDFGHVVHELVLGTGSGITVLDPAVHGLKKDGVVADNPRATSTWKTAEAEARERGQTPIHIDEHKTATDMWGAVRYHPVVAPLLDQGDPEVSLFTTDPETGVKLRARPDWMTHQDGRLYLVDLKTCADANPETFGRTAEKWGYYLQFAWYVTVARLLELDESPAFLFVCVEKEPPYLVSVCELDMDAYLLGRKHMREAIATYQRCMEIGEWPGYDQSIHSVSLPPWAFSGAI